jgi:hypothetical protein
MEKFEFWGGDKCHINPKDKSQPSKSKRGNLSLLLKSALTLGCVKINLKGM